MSGMGLPNIGGATAPAPRCSRAGVFAGVCLEHRSVSGVDSAFISVEHRISLQPPLDVKRPINQVTLRGGLRRMRYDNRDEVVSAADDDQYTTPAEAGGSIIPEVAVEFSTRTWTKEWDVGKRAPHDDREDR